MTQSLDKTIYDGAVGVVTFKRDQLMQSLRQEHGFVQVIWKEELGGLSSKNVAFEADSVSYVLKQYGESARARIDRLEAVAVELQQHGFPAPVPLLNQVGKRHFVCAGAIFAVFIRAEGKILHQASLSGVALDSTAILLSRLHYLGGVAARCLRPSRHYSEASAQAIKILEVDCQRSPWRDLVQQSLRLKARLRSTGIVQELEAWQGGCDFVHGDFHNENVVYDELCRAQYVLDFEESYLGHGICDAINFVQFACCNDDISAAGLSAGRRFLDSYTKAKPCSPAEIRLGWLSFFARMATSTWLEERLLAGDAFFAALIQRDIKKMVAHLRDGQALLEALVSYN